MRPIIDQILMITLDLFEERLPLITPEILSLHFYLVDCNSWRLDRKSLTEAIWHNKNGQPWSQEFVDAYQRWCQDQQYPTLAPVPIPELPEIARTILCSTLAKNYEKSAEELLALARESQPMQAWWSKNTLLDMQLIEESRIMKAYREAQNPLKPLI